MHPSEALSPRDAFAARVVAYLLDLLLICVAAGPLPGASGWLMALAFSLVYLGVGQGLTGYTFGKALLGARAVRAGTIEPPGVARGVLRWLLMPIGVPVVSALVAAFNDRRRGLGDLVAGTEVIGLAPAPKARLISVVAYFLLLSALVAAASIGTFLLVWGIFVPMILAGLVIVLGSRRMKGAALWLVGLGFAFVGAWLMSFVSLCEYGEGQCRDTAAGHKAIPALIALALAIAAVFLLRGAIARTAMIVLVLFGEIWMILRFRAVEDMDFATVILAALVVAQIAWEVMRATRGRRPSDELGAPAAAT